MASGSGSRRSQYFGESQPNIVDLDNMMDSLPNEYLTQESQEGYVDEIAPNAPPTQEEEHEQFKSQSDIFKIHFKRVTKLDGSMNVICNYYGQNYKFSHGGNYRTFRRYLEKKHPT